MSIKDGKVRIYFAAHRNRLMVGGLMLIQFVLTLVLSVSLAGQIVWPEQTKAAAGTPMQLSYEGRLTDSSGNALGGTGTPYCYRFSIYDSASGGNKLWPGGTPTQSISTTTDGVFNAIIGQADTLSSSVFDFSTTSTSYLNVEVNTATSTCGGTWESLTPRQPILSSAYALQANNIYGSYLKTDTVNGRVQVGTGAGAATPIYLGLDVKNVAEAVGQTCSTNGLMWYNSAISQALICEAGVMKGLGTAGTTTIAAVTANGATPISVGTVVLSNSNGVSFGVNGSTITASVNAAAGVTLSQWEPYMLATSTAATSLAPASAFFNTINLPDAVAISKVNLLRSFNFSVPAATSVASTGSEAYSFTQGFSVFTRQNYGLSSTNLSYLTSASFGMTLQYLYSSTSQSLNASWVTNSTGGTSGFASSSSNANLSSLWTGLKYVRVPLVTTLTAGEYWLGQQYSTTASTSNSGATILSLSNIALSIPVMTLGNFGTAGSLAGWHPGKQGVGVASAFTTNNTMAMSVITGSANQQFPYFNFVNF